MGISVMAVDILPASLPKDASESFAGAVKEYVRCLVAEQKGELFASGLGENGAELRKALQMATVAVGGRVTGGVRSSFDDGFREVLEGKVRRWRASQSVAQTTSASGTKTKKACVGGETEDIVGSAGAFEAATSSNKGMEGAQKKRVLVLGSGMVAGPAVDELAGRTDVEVIVGQY